MNNPKRVLESAGMICFALALFQAAIGFSPSLSLYFGAPESLVQNMPALISVSFFVAVLLSLFGLYALSGAGRIRKLPLLKQALIGISVIYILRGLFVIPNILVVTGVIETSINVPPRFICFSIGSLIIGVVFIIGIIGNWKSFSAANKNPIQQ